MLKVVKFQQILLMQLFLLKTIVFSTTEGLIASVSWAPSYEIFEATVSKVVQP